MSQAGNAGTSSSKRAYRRGAALSTSERKKHSVSRKRETHKPVNVFIRNALKEKLDALCQEQGITQAEAIEQLLEREVNGE
ncbi:MULTISPECIES: replication regulatory protein RepA [Enterobacter cloacae complex]|uniref:replication regulatory protein RepA n=1 Tax=Enterobacter cloacae complex TaxID=354276 RepID=UPI000907FA41|nr:MULTISPECIES: replication regulatory protein RepA [Enterobacter cloacae complex]EAM2340961.1 replication regulatory protein RepA [Salmonella enterica]EKS7429286.1 replication regulatory protein RepA [Enterobacter cancerogenus]ECF8133435.1 replication regulatory protein RepA [Salmonella enterica]EGI1954794.1 replication regulatory protein RepA [Salmonella enterica]EMA3597729.1 replication regulatory protein RepA [Salmonella enterica]